LSAALQPIAAGWAEHPDTLPWLPERAPTDDHESVRQAAPQAITAAWAEHPDTVWDAVAGEVTSAGK
jgi:hypothetical protein